MPSSLEKVNSIAPDQSILSPDTCVKKGFCPVTTRKGHNFDLYFEQHGRGNQFKVLMIMGFTTSLHGWMKQVEWFGTGKAFRGDREKGGEGEEKSTVLVFDNRCVGNSGYPKELNT
jgi:hypothetical protein